MGKNLTIQKRGKGSAVWRAPSFNYIGEVKHRQYADAEKTGVVIGTVKDLVHSAGHYSPIAKIAYSDNKESLELAPFGMKVGDTIQVGATAEVKDGNVLPLSAIPNGTPIFNIESAPGDGGKFVRSSGTFASILSRTESEIIIRLPSKKERVFNPSCRATIGVIAGGGRPDKPLLKAGVAFMKWGTRGKLYPKTSALSMNAVAHPFGGSSSAAKNGPLIASRYASAGAKVGALHPRRTGRKRGK